MKLPLPEEWITQLFGERPQDYARFGLAGHNGVDFGCVQGTPIKAVAAGVVERTGFDSTGYGYYVKLKHIAGYYTLYGHFSMIEVASGTVVKEGDLLGFSGNTGNSTGAHLHFEVRKIGEERNGYNGAVDPMTIDSIEQVEQLPKGYARSLTNNLNIRIGPGLVDAVIGKINYGDTVRLTGGETTNDGIVWREIGVWVAESRGSATYLQISNEE